MKFSIIIPTLNEQAGIEACLQALQPLRTVAEIVIVDGGSKDDTLILARPWADKVIHAKKGRAVQMNAGAREAVGSVLVFLHADTLLPDSALHSIAKGFKTGRQWGRFDITLEGGPFMLKIIAFMMNWRSRLTDIATGDQAIFVSRAVFEKAGGYPEIALMEDIALCKILKTIGPPLCLTAKVQSSGRRWEQFGTFKTILLMWSLRLRYRLGHSPDRLAELYRQGRFFSR